MTDMTFDYFADEPFGKAALKRIGDVDPNFRLYCAEWIGLDRAIMKVTGAMFRKAEKGKYKGLLSVKVEWTDHTVYVTRDEINSFRETRGVAC